MPINLVTYRKSNGLTQREIAELTGVSEATISRVERLQRTNSVGEAVHYTTSQRLRAIDQEQDLLSGVTITTNGRSIGSYGASGSVTHTHAMPCCERCYIALPVSGQCDFCGD